MKIATRVPIAPVRLQELYLVGPALAVAKHDAWMSDFVILFVHLVVTLVPASTAVRQV